VQTQERKRVDELKNEIAVAGGVDTVRDRRMLDERGFDEFVERQCGRFYAQRMGRPSLAPGRYFRLLLIGYFEGIDSERGIAWRAADSLALRSFLGVGLNQMPPCGG